MADPLKLNGLSAFIKLAHGTHWLQSHDILLITHFVFELELSVDLTTHMFVNIHFMFSGKYTGGGGGK